MKNRLPKLIILITTLCNVTYLSAQIYELKIEGFTRFGNGAFLEHLKKRFKKDTSCAIYDDETKIISFFAPAEATRFAVLRNPRIVISDMRPNDGGSVTLIGTYQRAAGASGIVSLYWHTGLKIESA